MSDDGTNDSSALPTGTIWPRIEEMIASKEAAIARQQQNIRQLLLEGRNVVAETNAMRVNAAALRRLQSERLATLNLINKYTSQ